MKWQWFLASHTSNVTFSDLRIDEIRGVCAISSNVGNGWVVTSLCHGLGRYDTHVSKAAGYECEDSSAELSDPVVKIID